MEDEMIIDLYFAREERAISETGKKYGSYCRSIAFNILHSHEDTEECVSDTYLHTWNTIPPTKPVHFFAYLAKICRHLAFDRLDWNNAAKRKAEVVALTQEMEECIPGQWQETDVRSAEISRLVGSFLWKQTADNRMIFVRRYWYGDSVSEIALRYEISQNAVMMRLSRTRSKLAAYLKKEGIRV